jgi:hypothetical protein
MEKLEDILQRIVENEDLTNEFSKQETMDDMYKFFLGIDSSISKEEFDTFIAKMLEEYGGSLPISDNMLQSVSGGVNSLGPKMASAVRAFGKIKNTEQLTGDLVKSGWSKTAAWIKNNPGGVEAIGSLTVQAPSQR